MNTNQTQEEIDRQQMIAGCLAGQNYIDMVRLDPNFKQEDWGKVMKHVKDLMIPESYKNISGDRLKDMIMSDYLKEASELMIKNYRERFVIIFIKWSDVDLLPKLTVEWTNKSINVETLPAEDKLNSKIKLSW